MRHRVRLALRGVALRGDAGCASFLHGAALGADIGGFPHRALRDVEPQYPVGKEPARGHGTESPFVPKAGSGGNASRHACLFGRHERNVGDGRPFFPLRRVRGQLCPPALPLPQGQPSRLQAPAPHDEAGRGGSGFRAFHCPLPPGFPGQSSSSGQGGRQFARVSPQVGRMRGGGAGVEGVCQGSEKQIE